MRVGRDPFDTPLDAIDRSWDSARCIDIQSVCKEREVLGSLLTLPFKILIGIIKKIVIGIPIMIGKTILMALVMALLPLIVVAADIYWFFTTQI